MHLYDMQGNPVYQVPYADPKKGMRDATLRDAKKMNLVPSVTTILQILDKPGLNTWKEKQVFWAAKTTEQLPDETDDQYYHRVIKDSMAASKQAAQTGTDIHNALEAVFKGEPVGSKYRDLANHVKNEIESHFKCTQWEAEKSFAHPLGFGGKVDLSSEMYGIVIDFKTKEKFQTDKKGNVVKMAYDEHCMQLAAYSWGLGFEAVDLANVFVSYDGDVFIHEWDQDEQIRCWSMFGLCLELWQLQKRYTPKMEIAA